MDRRRFLAASGSWIALPVLPSLTAQARGADAPRPKRLVFLGFGWGCTYESWYPKIDDQGADYVLTKGLAPLATHKRDFTVIQNLTNRRTNEGHWGSTFWLSSANRFAVPGSTFSNAISCDQAAARVLERTLATTRSNSVAKMPKAAATALGSRSRGMSGVNRLPAGRPLSMHMPDFSGPRVSR
jgi:hypothetical protein